MGVMLTWLHHRYDQLAIVRSRIKLIDKHAWKKFKRAACTYHKPHNSNWRKRISKYITGSDVISYMFEWEETPEGYNYWNNINTKYRELYGNL
jgi:hypothetical protein